MNHRITRYLAGTIAALSIAIAGGSALAAPKKDTHEAAMVATAANVDATFEHYVVSPRGHVEALLLGDGSIVRIPRGVDAKLDLKKGDAIHVVAKAHKTDAGTIYMRPLVTKGSETILDGQNPPKKDDDKGEKKEAKKAKLSKQTDKGAVEAFVIDGKGRRVGVVLADGTIGLAKHHEDLASLGVKKGDVIGVEGRGGAYATGTSMFLEKVTLANGTDVPLTAWKK